MQPPSDLEAFLVSERPRLVAAISLYVGDPYVAEELVQEACIRAAARWERVRQLDSPGGWTYRVARNLATSSLRRRQAERRARVRIGPASVREDEASDRLTVRTAVASLPPAQREAIVLRYFLGLDGPEVAARMGRSHGAVRALLKRGVAALRADLADQIVIGEETSDVP